MTMKSKLPMLLPLVFMANVSLAATETCPDILGLATRTATFQEAVVSSCSSQEGNTVAADIEAFYGGDWTELDEALGSGVDGAQLLNVVFTSVGNPQTGITGSWTINDASIWDSNSRLAFSTHIGNGSGTPDSWAWLIVNGQISGTFSISAEAAGNWNGFSNAKLFGEAGEVPIPAAAWLFGSGLIGLAGIARKRKAS